MIRLAVLCRRSQLRTWTYKSNRQENLGRVSLVRLMMKKLGKNYSKKVTLICKIILAAKRAHYQVIRKVLFNIQVNPKRRVKETKIEIYMKTSKTKNLIKVNTSKISIKKIGIKMTSTYKIKMTIMISSKIDTWFSNSSNSLELIITNKISSCNSNNKSERLLTNFRKSMNCGKRYPSLYSYWLYMEYWVTSLWDLRKKSQWDWYWSAVSAVVKVSWVMCYLVMMPLRQGTPLGHWPHRLLKLRANGEMKRYMWLTHRAMKINWAETSSMPLNSLIYSRERNTLTALCLLLIQLPLASLNSLGKESNSTIAPSITS